jgi:ATP-dependent exoDNAse (exonuclease V) alpha subunit
MEILFIILAIFVIIVVFSAIPRRTGQRPGLSTESPEAVPGAEVLEPPPIKEDSPVTKIPEENRLPKDFKLTEDFRRAFDLMEHTDYSIFITGRAGTGKSTLIEYFRMNTGKRAVYLAPTGVAALNIRGKTIHSLFQFPPEVVTSDKIINNRYKEETLRLFKALDVVVVDEISMVRADILEGMDYILRKFRDKNKPFGGVQMIFVGDIYQLAPVVDKKEKVKITHKGKTVFNGLLYDYFERKYHGHYFFNSDAFKKADFKYCVLNTIFRQKDDNQFITILNAIREKNIPDELLNQLNERYFEKIEERNGNEIILCTTNAIVNNINNRKMNALTTKQFLYKATVSGIFESEIGEKNYPAEKELVLKENAQVMMIKNDKDGRWVNGTIGIIKKLAHNKIDVKIHGTIFTINKETWEAVNYEYDEEEDELKTIIVGTYTQYPVKAAWAITVHKSQGKTFDHVIIDLGSGAFAHGQTYVALSRCKTLQGIRLKRPIQRRDIILDDKVIHFINEMNNRLIS